MPNVETLVWVLTGAMTLMGTMGGIIWKLVRDEAKEQASQIRNKLDIDRLTAAEDRWKQEIEEVKTNSEKLVNKLEVRHDKEMEQMAHRLGEQIRNTENNILTQIRLMIQVLQSSPHTQ